MVLRFPILLFFIFIHFHGSTAAQENSNERITSIADLRQLDSEGISRNIDVEIEAQITHISPTRDGLYLNDGEHGCYVALKTAETREIFQRPGQRVLVKGFSNADSYLPHIEAISIEPKGNAPLPLPVPLTAENFILPESDCAWTTVKGQVIKGTFDSHRFILTISAFGQDIELHLPNTLESSALSKSLFDAEIEVSGVLISESDDSGQLVDRHIGVPSVQYIRMTSEDRNQEIPLISIAELLQSDTPRNGSLRTKGIITYRDNSRVVLQYDRCGLLVRTTTPCLFERGDLVETVGLASRESTTTIFKAQSFRLLETSELPEPTRIEDLGKINREELDNTLVTLKAEIHEKRIAVNGAIISAEANGKVFQIGLPVSWTDLRDTPPHSIADITGIFQQATATAPLNPVDPDSFQLLVMDTEDITILKRQGWWTPRRFQTLLTIFAIVGAILAMALTWVWLLRRKVAEQTDTIRAQIAQESSASERERVARELHDSLEQNLAAVALQIENVIRFHKNEKFDKLGHALDVTKKMAKACQRESREAIYDLRGSDEESATWRDEMLLSEAERLGADIRLKISGKSYSLEADAKRQLRRIVREATYNSLRHGEATEVIVEYDYTPELFTAKVIDNGSGFDTKGPRPEGHFGLAGMEERAGRIGANFLLESAVGSGTTVSIRLPVKKT